MHNLVLIIAPCAAIVNYIWRQFHPSSLYLECLQIRFDISEFVEEVSGAYGSHFGNVLVTSLTFVTNIRTYGPFGTADHQNVPATPFRFKADKDSRIVGFHGRSGKHLYSIGVYTV